MYKKNSGSSCGQALKRMTTCGTFIYLLILCNVVLNYSINQFVDLEAKNNKCIYFYNTSMYEFRNHAIKRA